jgi:putative transport protein
MTLFGGVIPITGLAFLMFCVFAILAVGFLIGRITIKGISLGSAGVFLAALLFGCLFYGNFESGLGSYDAKSSLKIIENLGLILFVTSVGFIAGPKFFSNMKKNFTSYVMLGLIIIIAGGLTAVGCILFGTTLGGETDPQRFTAMVAGLLSGALTSTPAFSAAKETVGAEFEDIVSLKVAILTIGTVI